MKLVEELSAAQKKELLARLMRRVQKSKVPDGCWLWAGADNGHGYSKS